MNSCKDARSTRKPAIAPMLGNNLILLLHVDSQDPPMDFRASATGNLADAVSCRPGGTAYLIVHDVEQYRCCSGPE